MKLVTFDVETSGVDTDNDRIITCFMRAREGDEVVFEKNWVIDPGIEIPKEASDVHGMTTEWIREHGRKDTGAAIREIASALEGSSSNGFIIGGYNHSFDLSMLDAELQRHEETELRELLGPETHYIDPLAIDRGVDRYRRGSRKLMDVAKHYGIPVDESRLHEAEYDVEVTEKLIPKVLNKAWRSLAGEREGMSKDEFVTLLQGKQKGWKARWAEGITAYFAKEGKTEDDGSPIIVSGAFPW